MERKHAAVFHLQETDKLQKGQWKEFHSFNTEIAELLEDAKETLTRAQNFVKCATTTFDVHSPEGKEGKLFYGNTFELATKALKLVEQHATRADKTQRAFLAKFGECVSSKGGDRKTRKNMHQYDRRMASQIDIHKNQRWKTLAAHQSLRHRPKFQASSLRYLRHQYFARLT